MSVPNQPATTADQDRPTPWTVSLQPLDQSFPVLADQTILQAAELAGLTLASSCRNGTCRSCLCFMAAGQVAYRIEWPGLSAEEKSEGWILPCVAYPKTDLLLHTEAVLSASTPANSG